MIMEMVMLLFVLMSCARTGYAVTAENNNGNEFIVAVFLHQDTCHASLHFTGKEGTIIRVESPAHVHPFTYLTIGSELSTTHDLNPEYCFDVKNNAIDRKGFRITSSDDISVSVVNIPDRLNGEAYLVLPTRSLSTEFIAVSCPSNVEYSKLMVVASDNDTDIKIRLRTSSGICSGSGFTRGQDIALTLNNMEVFGLYCNEDFTGTHISSSKPIAVMSGCHGAKRPPAFYTEPVVDMLIPVDMYGKSYILYNIDTSRKVVYRVVAAYRNTNIELAGQAQGTMQEGEYIDMETTDAGCLNSSEPILVVAFNKNVYVYAEYFMATVQSTDHFMSSYLLDTKPNPIAAPTILMIVLVSTDPSIASIAANNGMVQGSSQSACGFNIWLFNATNVLLVDLQGSTPFGLLCIRVRGFIGMAYSGGFRKGLALTSTKPPITSTAVILSSSSGLATSTYRTPTGTTSAYVPTTTSTATTPDSSPASTKASTTTHVVSQASTTSTASTMGYTDGSTPTSTGTREEQPPRDTGSVPTTDAVSGTTLQPTIINPPTKAAATTAITNPNPGTIRTTTPIATITTASSTFSVSTTTSPGATTVQLDHNGQPVRTVREKCTCFCKPENRLDVLTSQAVLKQKANLQNKLQVKTSNLASTISKKTSAPDSRTSSTSVGYLAISFVMIPFLLFMFADLSHMIAAVIHICSRKTS